MAITLDAITLPNGLRWIDEFDWSGVVQTVSHGRAGALRIDYARPTGDVGRPITLVGGRNWAWMERGDVETLHAALAVVGTEFTLTLHDARTFTVSPRVEGDEHPLRVSPLPLVRDSGPANPSSTYRYVVEEIRLQVA